LLRRKRLERAMQGQFGSLHPGHYLPRSHENHEPGLLISRWAAEAAVGDNAPRPMIHATTGSAK